MRDAARSVRCPQPDVVEQRWWSSSERRERSDETTRRTVAVLVVMIVVLFALMIYVGEAGRTAGVADHRSPRVTSI